METLVISLSFIEYLSYGPGICLGDERTEIATMDPRNRLFICNFNKVWSIFLPKNMKALREAIGCVSEITRPRMKVKETSFKRCNISAQP